MNEIESAYDAWHSAVAEDGLDTPTADWHLLAKSALGNISLEGIRVLEIACGRGGFSQWLAEKGARLTAADFSGSAVELTCDRIASFIDCEAVKQDLQSLSYADETFDIVVSLETLEHLPDPLLGMRELVRVTKKGGRIVLTGPNYIGTSGLHRLYVEATGREYTEAGQPLNRWMFLPIQVRRLKRLGCKIRSVRARGHYIPFPGRQPFRLRWIDWDAGPHKWLALHSMILADRVS